MYKTGEEGLRNYAFFPLFPLIWKATGLNGLGISIFNWVVFCLGMIFICLIFKDRIKDWMFLLVLLIPMLSVFMIPYTESLFFFCISLGLYGIVKQKYSLYFTGFFLASAVRSSSALLFAVFLCAEIIRYLYSGNIRQSAVNFIKNLLPVISGVAVVIIIQMINGSPRWFFFVEAQKFWGKYLSLPSLPFTDWSEEGKCVTTPFLIMYFVPCVAVIFREFFTAWKSKDKKPMTLWQYVRLLCVLYLTGNVFIAVLTQHGSLNSLARYMLCTPFFVFLLLDTAKNDREPKWRHIYILIGIAAVFICLRHFLHSNGLGIYLVMLGSLLTFFHGRMPKKLLYVLLAAGILFSVVWTAYLYNVFLTDAWIYT